MRICHGLRRAKTFGSQGIQTSTTSHCNAASPLNRSVLSNLPLWRVSISVRDNADIWSHAGLLLHSRLAIALNVLVKWKTFPLLNRVDIQGTLVTEEAAKQLRESGRPGMEVRESPPRR